MGVTVVTVIGCAALTPVTDRVCGQRRDHATQLEGPKVAALRNHETLGSHHCSGQWGLGRLCCVRAAERKWPRAQCGHFAVSVLECLA